MRRDPLHPSSSITPRKKKTQNAAASAPIKELRTTKTAYEEDAHTKKKSAAVGVTVASPPAAALLMIWLEDPGEPFALIDVKCATLPLIKAEASKAAQTGSLTCLMGMARPLPMLSARASSPFLSLSVSLAFLDCGPDETVTVSDEV